MEAQVDRRDRRESGGGGEGLEWTAVWIREIKTTV